ncbi:RNA polymerase sigma factor [Candidatus Sororendozoicomonas aggregata]|uniref:RNA polymerase sigma factor n=1 Tax=Candidatus Sororendozoicomonas aggregata TaxID=3073239 RepID=UPI002ED1CCA0
MSTNKAEIEALFARVQHHDADAFKALYACTHQRLYAIIITIVKDEATAADILQEGYLKLWLAGASYPVRQPWAWLCQTMRNQAIDEYRKRQRLSPEPETPTVMDEKTTMDVFQKNTMAPSLHHCLLQLEADKRSAIVLAYQHGYSHTDIAGFVQKPIGTVKSWIRRGLKELKQCIKP